MRSFLWILVHSAHPTSCFPQERFVQHVLMYSDPFGTPHQLKGLSNRSWCIHCANSGNPHQCHSSLRLSQLWRGALGSGIQQMLVRSMEEQQFLVFSSWQPNTLHPHFLCIFCPTKFKHHQWPQPHTYTTTHIGLHTTPHTHNHTPHTHAHTHTHNHTHPIHTTQPHTHTTQPHTHTTHTYIYTTTHIHTHTHQPHSHTHTTTHTHTHTHNHTHTPYTPDNHTHTTKHTFLHTTHIHNHTHTTTYTHNHTHPIQPHTHHTTTYTHHQTHIHTHHTHTQPHT